MQDPKVLGRTLDDDSIDERAATKLVNTFSVPYEGGAVGEITVSVYQSTDDEDRGGIVLRITSTDQASSFISFAKTIDDGIEIHMAGDIEAKSMVQALKTALARL